MSSVHRGPRVEAGGLRRQGRTPLQGQGITLKVYLSRRASKERSLARDASGTPRLQVRAWSLCSMAALRSGGDAHGLTPPYLWCCLRGPCIRERCNTWTDEWCALSAILTAGTTDGWLRSATIEEVGPSILVRQRPRVQDTEA
ncbi:hypothetical protein NDU88_000687 [Pleurodeles waltl]|uniref:Uncharacterized protein n=1 Tax=Pleurodeles waltl TaxID=8319 RepID=A0AAV7TFR8_PLEWA|nr:hypothetical protein NDU88_000687 [Pleurodeles waltl]